MHYSITMTCSLVLCVTLFLCFFAVNRALLPLLLIPPPSRRRLAPILFSAAGVRTPEGASAICASITHYTCGWFACWTSPKISARMSCILWARGVAVVEELPAVSVGVDVAAVFVGEFWR